MDRNKKIIKKSKIKGLTYENFKIGNWSYFSIKHDVSGIYLLDLRQAPVIKITDFYKLADYVFKDINWEELDLSKDTTRIEQALKNFNKYVTENQLGHKVVKPEFFLKNLRPILTEKTVSKLEDKFDTGFYESCKNKIVNVRKENDKLIIMNIKDKDYKEFSFIWSVDYLPTKEYQGKLEPFQTLETYHTFGYYGLFKPSLGEIYSQIRNSLTDEEFNKVKAFELLEVSDKQKMKYINSHNVHNTTIQLYI